VASDRQRSGTSISQTPLVATFAVAAVVSIAVAAVFVNPVYRILDGIGSAARAHEIPGR
jgi:hypothetical protein